jgi:hypothetical protein
MKYEPAQSGEWIYPERRDFMLSCCDCGLVHRFDFKLKRSGKRHKILFRAFRDNRATAQLRRHRFFTHADNTARDLARNLTRRAKNRREHRRR